MKKDLRLKRNSDIQKVFKNGKSYANRQFVVYKLRNDEIEEYRFALSVSKKLGNAVVRNQIKRYVRRSLFEMKDDLKRNFDYIVIARQPVANMNFHEIKKSLSHVLSVARVIKK